MSWRIPVATQSPLSVTQFNAKVTRRHVHIDMLTGSNAHMILEGQTGFLKKVRMLMINAEGVLGADILRLEWDRRESNGQITTWWYIEDTIPNGEAYSFLYYTGGGATYNNKATPVWEYIRPMPDIEIDDTMAIYLSHIDLIGSYDMIYDEVSIL